MARLKAILEQPALENAAVGALIVSTSGQELLAYQADTQLIPASNLKILTNLAALAAFGPSHRFTTSVYAATAPKSDGLVSKLYIRGGGDPALTSEEWWRLAADLRRGGLRAVRNGIVLDATAFDEERWNPAWGPTVARAYHAPVAGLSANYGSFTVEARPALKEGDPLRVSLDPPVGHFTLVNQGRTAGQRSRPSLQVTRQAFERGERVVVSGTLGVGASPQVVHRSVIDPVRYAGTVLRMQLEANGVEIAGPTEIGTVPETARLLLEYKGKSLAEIVRLCMKYSNNAIAESLVKAMGAQASGGAGSWRDGIAAMRRKLQALGMEMSSSTLVDGSGLSRDNRISARTLVQALRIARSSFGFGSEIIGALPIAARDGTLEKRAGGAAGRVRAKTGLLNSAAGLSGFAQLTDGSEVIFSVLLNGYRVGDGTAMAIVDEFASTLVQSTLKDFQPREQANRRDGRTGP